MVSYKKYILIVLSACIVLAAGYFGYKYYRELKNPVLPAIGAIPENTVFFAEFNNTPATWNKLAVRTDLWKELIHIKPVRQIHRQLNILDSLIKTDNVISEIIEQNKVLISMHPVDTGRFDLLFLVEFPSLSQEYTIENFIKNALGKKSIVFQKIHNNVKINTVNIAGTERLFYCAVCKGVFLGSFSELLVTAAINQLNSGKPVERGAGFQKIKLTAGKKVDANFFLNYRYFQTFLSKYTHPSTSSSVKHLSEFAQWSEIDLIIKNNELLLNGYTVTSDSSGQFLDCFRQEPQPVDVIAILPYDVSVLLDFGFEDFEKFMSGYKNYLKNIQVPNDLKNSLNKINRKYGVNLQNQFFSWIGNEAGIAFAEPSGNPGKNCYVFFRTNDIKKAAQNLYKIAQNAGRRTGKEQFAREYNEYRIGRIDIPGFIPEIFGPWFSHLKNNYFITIKEYVVFANNPEALIHLINCFYKQKTLSENFNYQAFSDNISERSNIYLYCNIKKSLDLIKPLLNKELETQIENNEDVIQTFEGLALQFSYINRMFYTNIYLKYNPTYREVNPSSWETETNARITGKPFFVRNHKTGKLNVVVFDEFQNIYLIDHTGLIKWKIPLPENPVSDVYIVDYYKNRKFQYLFNSKNYLFLIDINGSNVADYPVRLATAATNGISVFDYERKNEYRLLLGLEDNKIYNYNIKGELVEGWKKIQAKTTVPYPAEHITAKNKDYILITDKNGNVTITNRRGQARIRLKKNFVKAKNSKFYKNETNSKGIIITTDENGKLTYISPKGKISKTSFGDFSPGHFFLYEDFDGDNSKDFIFLDNNTLTIFNKFKKVIQQHTFNSEITVKPVFFTLNGSKSYLGVIDSKTKEVFIFDKSGRVFTNQYISGETPFIVGSLNNDGKTNLVICSGNKVTNYLLE